LSHALFQQLLLEANEALPRTKFNLEDKFRESKKNKSNKKSKEIKGNQN